MRRQNAETSDAEMPVIEQTQSFPGAFCEPCNKWRKPNALLANGSCPRCGTQLDENAGAVAASAKAQDAPKIPWHFWVMVAATALYLGWRCLPRPAIPLLRPGFLTARYGGTAAINHPKILGIRAVRLGQAGSLVAVTPGCGAVW